MGGSIRVDTLAFCEKFYEYGGLIWLLGRAGVILPIGTALTAMLLFATSYAECWLPERSAEITDGMMALVIGGAFAVLRRVVPRPTESTAPNAALPEHARLAGSVHPQDDAAPGAPRRSGRKFAPYLPPHLRG
jgi:hypothetical protein